jgi:hypothetical protein
MTLHTAQLTRDVLVAPTELTVIDDLARQATPFLVTDQRHPDLWEHPRRSIVTGPRRS